MAEYIEREAVNALIKAECSPKVAAYLIDAVATIPAADVRPVKWIPVTERLPEDDTGVLAHVYWPKYGDTMVCYGHWHKGWCHLYHHVEGELISGYVVTHWMPLPQPPKEET